MFCFLSFCFCSPIGNCHVVPLGPVSDNILMAAPSPAHRLAIYGACKQVIKRKLTDDSCKSQNARLARASLGIHSFELRISAINAISNCCCAFVVSYLLFVVLFDICMCSIIIFLPSRVRDFNNNKSRTQHWAINGNNTTKQQPTIFCSSLPISNWLLLLIIAVCQLLIEFAVFMRLCPHSHPLTHPFALRLN